MHIYNHLATKYWWNFIYRLSINGRSRYHNLFREILKNFQNFCKFPQKLWRHLTTNFKLLQAVKKAISCSEKHRKQHENRLINTEDTPTCRRSAPTARAWQTYKNKQTKNSCFSFSCRRTFIDFYQTLHANRGRQYNFCHRQLFLDPIISFFRQRPKTHF